MQYGFYWARQRVKGARWTMIHVDETGVAFIGFVGRDNPVGFSKYYETVPAGDPPTDPAEQVSDVAPLPCHRWIERAYENLRMAHVSDSFVRLPIEGQVYLKHTLVHLERVIKVSHIKKDG